MTWCLLHCCRSEWWTLSGTEWTVSSCSKPPLTPTFSEFCKSKPPSVVNDSRWPAPAWPQCKWPVQASSTSSQPCRRQPTPESLSLSNHSLTLRRLCSSSSTLNVCTLEASQTFFWCTLINQIVDSKGTTAKIEAITHCQQGARNKSRVWLQWLPISCTYYMQKKQALVKHFGSLMMMICVLITTCVRLRLSFYALSVCSSLFQRDDLHSFVSIIMSYYYYISL